VHSTVTVYALPKAYRRSPDEREPIRGPRSAEDAGAVGARTQRVQAILSALADPTRLEIYERLASGPLAVGDLARTFPLSRPAISQHLRVLKDAGLATDTAYGTRRVYALDPNGVAALRAFLDRCCLLAASTAAGADLEGTFS
jgi:DNA-binding transcriptional ArsR family regulator